MFESFRFRVLSLSQKVCTEATPYTYPPCGPLPNAQNSRRHSNETPPDIKAKPTRSPQEKPAQSLVYTQGLPTPHVGN